MAKKTIKKTTKKKPAKKSIRVKKARMTRDGAKGKTSLFSIDGGTWFTKPNTDKRSSEWWSNTTTTSNGKKKTRYTLMAAMPAPKWLRDHFKKTQKKKR